MPQPSRHYKLNLFTGHSGQWSCPDANIFLTVSYSNLYKEASRVFTNKMQKKGQKCHETVQNIQFLFTVVGRDEKEGTVYTYILVC